MPSKILELCPVARPYHAVYCNPEPDPEDECDKLIYVDVPFFARVEVSNGKIEICPIIIQRNGEGAIAWETENYIGCSEVDLNDDEYWLGLHEEQEEEREAARRTKKKGKGRTHQSHSRRTEPEDEEERDDEDDDEPEGDVQLSGRRR